MKLTNLKKCKSYLKIVHLKILILFKFYRNPTVQTDTWEPVSKNPNDILRCLNIYSPINFEMNDFNTNSIDFWKNLLPSEYRFEFHPQKRSNEF